MDESGPEGRSITSGVPTLVVDLDDDEPDGPALRTESFDGDLLVEDALEAELRMTGFRGTPDYAALEKLATRMRSNELREAVLRA